MIKQTLALIGLTLSLGANAALVDHGSFTYDSDQGLDWLDFTETAGLTYTAALSANSSWRLATNAEIEVLHATAFDGYSDTNTSSHFSSALGGGTPYADQEEDFSKFINLFGDTGYPAQSSRGFYLDESSMWRLIGATVASDNTLIFGTDFGFDGSSDVDSGRDGYGFSLVRTSVVPIPAAAWLFGSAILGLAGVARRKKLKA
jgi:hypothetical protein